jgi:DNA-binding NtrC family response regulator
MDEHASSGAKDPAQQFRPADARASEAPEREVNGLMRGSGRILIMDDEAIIRDAAGRILQAAGYDVDCAAEGNKAVELYGKAVEAGRPFDVVILDLTVQGGPGGRETIERLREMDQAVKAIVSSGYSQDPVMVNYRNYGFRGVIAKPYKMRDLSETVKRVINEGPLKS